MHTDRYGYEQSQYHNRMQIKKEMSILHNGKSLRMLITYKEHDRQHESKTKRNTDPKCKLGNKFMNIRDDSIKTDSV